LDTNKQWINELFFRSIAVNRNDYIYVGSDDGIFRSTDNGDSWHHASSGISNDNVRSIAINQNGFLFVGTYGGVFWSTDNGEYWSELNSGLTGYAVYKLSINPAGYIIASTNYGMFKSLNTTTNVNTNGLNRSREYQLQQNYPNPFNPSTTIKFKVPELSFVTIKVYDALGNEITTLVDEEKPAGKYEVEFNANSHSGEVRNLPSGIYFYRLKAGDYIATKKMVLLK